MVAVGVVTIRKTGLAYEYLIGPEHHYALVAVALKVETDVFVVT
jgi:hypothetical protein